MGGTALSKEDMENICKLYFLQTLCLIGCSINKIPKMIEKLVELRKLDLSKNRELMELPDSMCSLLQLQTLNLQFCTFLFRFPKGMHRLQNLKHLNIRAVIGVLPQGVGQLSGLHTLRGAVFHAGSGRNKLGLLKKLNGLAGSLQLVIGEIRSTSELEELVKDCAEAELKNKQHLHKLEIKFNYCEFDEEEQCPSMWVDVIEALEPNNNLKHLEIDGYSGQRLPRWISSPLSLLREIVLKYFSRIQSLPPMGKLPMLESLDVSRFPGLKVVGVEWLGIESSFVSFPKLKKLTFWSCEEWERWEDITAEEEESAALHIMPCLTHLHINGCDGLKMLPHRLLRKAPSLQVLDIKTCAELIKCYGDEDGEAWRSISQSHPQLQLVTQDSGLM